MPETVRMALARCCQIITNVTVQEDKSKFIIFPLDKGHFITEGCKQGADFKISGRYERK